MGYKDITIDQLIGKWWEEKIDERFPSNAGRKNSDEVMLQMQEHTSARDPLKTCPSTFIREILGIGGLNCLGFRGDRAHRNHNIRPAKNCQAGATVNGKRWSTIHPRRHTQQP